MTRSFCCSVSSATARSGARRVFDTDGGTPMSLIFFFRVSNVMWDVFLLIATVNASVFGLRALFVMPGLCFAGCVLAMFGALGGLPVEMDDHGLVSLYNLVCMAVLQDGIQFAIHVGEHRCHLRSHNIHHKNVHPCSLNAFQTGWVDAIVQLIVPLGVTLWAIRPNKTTAGVFGAWYSLWLQWIHADDPASLKLHSRVFVTPAFHRRHHTHPYTNLGHVLVCWDQLTGTASF